MAQTPRPRPLTWKQLKAKVADHARTLSAILREERMSKRLRERLEALLERIRKAGRR